MIPNSYRILKLTSGEQIICEIVCSAKKKFKIKRPMTFRSALQLDPRGGQKEFTVLRDWLSHTQEIETQIPSDFVVAILKPSSEIVKLYDREKEAQDVGHDESTYKSIDDLKSIIDNEIEQMINSMTEEEGDGDVAEEGDDMMIVSVALPYSDIEKLFKSGLFSEEDFKQSKKKKKNMREKISENEDTSSELHRDDFGTKWTDWSPYIEDYLNDEETEGDEKE